MPDHAHLIFLPYEDYALEKVIAGVKSISARRINKRSQRHGHIWQHESFDRILRSDEDRRQKGEYICENPVRAGIVTSVEEYPWIWRCWIEGEKKAAGGGGPT